MAAQPVVVQPQAAQTVVFTCARCPHLTLVYQVGRERFVVDNNREVIYREPDVYIKFRNGFYQTSDEKEIAFIRNHPNYTGRARTGGPDKQIIFERAPIDPKAHEAWLILQRLGATKVVEAVEKQYGIQSLQQVQDPIMATAQAQVQGVTQNASTNTGIGL